MSDTRPPAAARQGDTATAVGAVVLGSLALLVAFRRGFGSVMPRIGG